MKIRAIIGIALAFGLASCASHECSRCDETTCRAHAEHHGHGPHGMGAMCPMQVPGTTATATDVEGGVAMTFTTSGDVAEVRGRVRRMAAMHEEHHAGGDMPMGAHHDGHPAACEHHGHGHGHGEGPDHGDHHECMAVPPSSATAEDVEGGARLILRPTDPADLPALREHVRMHAERMNRGECPMMHDDMHGPETTSGSGTAP